MAKKGYFLYKIVFDKLSKMYSVVGLKDGFVWNEATNTKGAIKGAQAVGIDIRDIDFNGNYVPLKEL